jgi:corrinoid protein of di/trimethylamine methyltransferase
VTAVRILFAERNGLMETLAQISLLVGQGRARQIGEAVEQALAEGIAAKTILEDGLLAGMNIIGEKFKNNEVFVPEVLVAARAMNKGVEVLKPHLQDGDTSARGRAVIGTVRGDLHDIGKNLVRLMMEGKGIEMFDLGVDVAPEQFVQAAKEHDADLVCCSALLTTTMREMKNVVQALADAGLRERVKVMVGGAPVTAHFCEQVGADLYTPDAATAAEKAVELLA